MLSAVPRGHLGWRELTTAHLADAGLLAVVEGEAKGVAEGGKRPLGGIGLGTFKRELMCLPRG